MTAYTEVGRAQGASLFFFFGLLALRSRNHKKRERTSTHRPIPTHSLMTPHTMPHTHRVLSVHSLILRYERSI